jgi:hypothetical protein
MKKRILILALLIIIVGACKQSADMSELLSKFKEVPMLSPEQHHDAVPASYLEISKDLIDKYLKNFDYKEFESSKLLKFYAIERMLVDADFYILTLGIDHDLTGKPHTSLILITVGNNGQVLAQIPLEGYWDKRRYDYKKIENLKVDDETKKFSGVEIYIDQGIYDENFESYTLEGTAVKFIQKDGNILQTEFFADEDFVEGEEIDVNAFLNQFKMAQYPVEVEHVNSPCADGIINMADYGYSSSGDTEFSPAFRLPDHDEFFIVVLCLAGVPQEEAAFSVFVMSKWGTVVSSMEIASAKQKGDIIAIKSAVFDKEDQFTLSVQEGEKLVQTIYTFASDGSIKEVN